jgi:NitT/TauT family transport system substrate-binding protein
MRLVQDGTRPPLRRGVSRRSCRAVACLPAALLIAGCGLFGGSSGGLSSGGNQTITVAAVPGVGDAPLYVALREGLFRQRGLHVTIANYSSLRDEIQALGSGQADIAAGDYADFFFQQSHGALDLRLIADGYDAAPNVMAVLTLPTSHISSPQDLVNRTVATPLAQAIKPSRNLPYSSNLPYSMEMMATQAVLRTDGVGPTSIRWKPMPEREMINALKNHTVSAIVATEPYLLETESRLGAVSVLDSCSGVTSGLPLLGYFTVRKFETEHAQALRAFRSALLSAQAAAAMRGPVQETLTSSMHMNNQSAALLTLGQYPTFLSIGQVQRVADLMYDAGMISSPLAVRTLASG